MFLVHLANEERKTYKSIIKLVATKNKQIYDSYLNKQQLVID